jgi:hypothetical protein
MKRKQALWWTAGAVALALVFASYLQRDFVFSVANQVWACF